MKWKKSLHVVGFMSLCEYSQPRGTELVQMLCYILQGGTGMDVGLYTKVNSNPGKLVFLGSRGQ